MTERSMAIAGATGLVGAAAVDAALARGWKVVALVRKGRSLPPRAGLSVLECDFDALAGSREAVAAHAPAAFLCCLGTTIRTAGSQAAFARVDLEYVKAFAELGIACGAVGFGLVSSVGASATSSNFYLRTKGEAEQAAREAGYSHVEIARPSFLTGDRAENRPGEKLAVPVATLLAPLLVGGLSIYRPIAGATVARALVVALEKPAGGAFVRHYAELTRLAGA